jgi:hypothetical protein
MEMQKNFFGLSIHIKVIARCQLPSYTWLIREGFSDEEMKLFNELVPISQLIYRDNYHLDVEGRQIPVE